MNTRPQSIPSFPGAVSRFRSGLHDTAINHKVALLTREYPPEVYGGAGTAVEYLARELRHLAEVTVHCWGAPRDEAGVTSHEAWSALSEPKPESAALQAMSHGERKDVLDCYPAVHPERVNMIHNKIDPAIYKPKP